MQISTLETKQPGDYLLIPCSGQEAADNEVSHTWLVVPPEADYREVKWANGQSGSLEELRESLPEDAKVYLSGSHSICPPCKAAIFAVRESR